MFICAALSGCTLMVTYGTDTPKMNTSFWMKTYNNATTVSDVSSAVNQTQYAMFTNMNAKISSVQGNILWYPVAICTVITILVHVMVFRETRKVRGAIVIMILRKLRWTASR